MPDDVDALLSFHSDPDSVRYVPYEPRDRAAVQEVVERKVRSTSLQEEGDLIELAVVLPGPAGGAEGPDTGSAGDQTGELIGDVLLALRSVEHQTLEVGYIFSPRHLGRGYATETVLALLGLAFGELGMRRVVARVDERNTASRALLERVGMRLEAHLVENEWLKGELTSEVDYALLAREWHAR